MINIRILEHAASRQLTATWHKGGGILHIIQVDLMEDMDNNALIKTLADFATAIEGQLIHYPEVSC